MAETDDRTSSAAQDQGLSGEAIDKAVSDFHGRIEESVANRSAATRRERRKFGLFLLAMLAIWTYPLIFLAVASRV